MTGGRRRGPALRSGMRPVALAAAALGLALAPSPAAAQGVSVEIQPARSSVTVGQTFRVDVVVTSDLGSAETLSDLHAPGFDVVGSHQSQSLEFSFGTGRNVQRVQLVRTYTLRAQHPGTHTLGPVVARVGGRVWSSGTAQVHVAPGAGGNVVGPSTFPPATPATPPATPTTPTTPTTPDGDAVEEVPRTACRMPNGQPLPASGADGPAICTLVRPDLFLQLEVTDVRVYLGEPLRMRIRAYVARELVGFSVGQLFSQILRREAGLEGFLRTNLEPHEIQIESQVVQGRRYLWTTLRDKLLYPTRAGELTIGPARGRVAVSDIFRRREILRETAALPIEVLRLPDAGRPDGFSPNNVGAGLTGRVTASPESVRAGQPFELTVTLTGEGNLGGFRIEPPQLPGATVIKSSDRVVEPTADRLAGSRSVTFLVTPAGAGDVDLSGYGVPYFDYAAREYRTAGREPVRVAVAPAAGDAAPAPPATAAATAGAAPHGPTASIRPWDDLGRPSAPLHSRALFWVLFLLPPTSLLGLFAVTGAARALRRRRGIVRPGDVLRRSQATLRRIARGRAGGDATAQLAAVEAALLDALEARLGEPLRGYATAELRRRLVAAGFAETLVAQIATQLESCAFGRFAPSASRGQGAADVARSAQDVLRAIGAAKLPRPAEAAS